MSPELYIPDDRFEHLKSKHPELSFTSKKELADAVNSPTTVLQSDQNILAFIALKKKILTVSLNILE